MRVTVHNGKLRLQNDITDGFAEEKLNYYYDF